MLTVLFILREGELKQQQNKLDESLQQFSFLSADSEDFIEPQAAKKSAANVTYNFISINEKIARDGTKFFTSDFIFQNQSIRSGGHSIGSLAIVAGAGAVLRHIRQYWPEFTALNGSFIFLFYFIHNINLSIILIHLIYLIVYL
jgi:hypothetical protein